MKIFVNDVFKETNERYIPEFDKEHLFLLLALQENYSAPRGRSVFTFGMIYDMHNITNRRLQTRLIDKFYELEEWGQIIIHSEGDIKKNTTVSCNFILQDAGFTMVDYSLISKIVESDFQHSQQMDMLFLLFVLESFRNNAHKHSFPSREKIKENMGINSNSILTAAINNLVEVGAMVYYNIPHREKTNYYNSIYVLTDKENYEEVLRQEVNKRLGIK